MREAPVTYYLLIGNWSPGDLKATRAAVSAGTLDPEELVRLGRAVRG
jgi:hypothetical protein